MTPVFNFNFPVYKFVPLFLHTTEDIFEKQNQHKMNEWDISK